MLSSLLGMNSASTPPSTAPATQTPNSAGGSSATSHHHHGLGAYVEGLASTAASLVSIAAV